MRNQRFHPIALLLAVAAHLGFGLALGESTARDVHSSPTGVRGVIVARLNITAGAGASHPASDLVERAPFSDTGSDKVRIKPNDTSADFSETEAKKPSDAVATLPIMAEPYYFPPEELTEKPHLLLDIPPDKVGDLPDISPPPAIARLLINEQGNIDKVLIESSSLSEKARQFVIDSFSNVKFRPGKLGDMAVRSELRIEIMLRSTTPTTVSVVH